MGINRAGLVAAVLNRSGSLGPAPGKRSRGDLPLIALDHGRAADAAAAITALDGSAFRSFNMVLADRSAVWFVRNDEAGWTLGWELAPGLHMVTAHDPDDPASPRVARHLPRFRAAAPPVPPDWAGWARLLGDEEGSREAALSVLPQGGFGTASASLLGVPAEGPATWLFASGRAGAAPFEPATLDSGDGGGRLL